MSIDNHFHLLSKLKITNYKSVKEEIFDLNEYTALVGYNNAGKSNILETITWLLRKSVLPKESFNDPSKPVEVEGTIIGITSTLLSSLDEKHKKSIEPYIKDGVLAIKRIQPAPGGSVKEIKLFVKNSLEINAKNPWADNPGGIDNAISDLFPEPIHICAMENAEEDISKSRNTTTIGKLISEIIMPIEKKYGESLTNELAVIKELLDADGKSRVPELKAFDKEISDKILSFFPGVTAKLHVPTPEIKEVFTRGTIKVYEGGIKLGRDAASLGHGAQRSIQMALIQHLAELKRSEDNFQSTRLLLIDEPELYLHPQAIEIVRDALKTLSGKGYQVIFSTHSPFMITAKDVRNTLLIRSNTERGTIKRCTLLSAIEQIEQEAPSQLLLMYSLSNSSSILFSERVILTEGKTEKRLLPSLVHKVTGKTLGLHKCALVEQGGVANTAKSIRVLQAMDLPVKAIADLDYAFRYAVTNEFLNADDSDIRACKDLLSRIASSNNICLDSDGWPKKENSSMTASEAFVFLSKKDEIKANIINLKVKLLSHGIWIWLKGTIEEHLQLPGKNEAVWANYLNRLDNEELGDVIEDYEEVRQCIEWALC